MPSRNRAPTRRALAARRSGIPCRVIGCKNPRDRSSYSAYCRRHHTARLRYGHEQGRRIFGKAYRRERDEVRALFDAHPDHIGVQHATQFIADWMRDASEGRNVPGAMHVARLQRQGIDPREALIETCALFAYAWRNPYALPSDQRLTYHLAISMLRLAPRDRLRAYRSGARVYVKYHDAGATDRAAIGNHLRQQLARLYGNVAATLERREQQVREAHESLGDPFDDSANSSTNNEGST
jgi:hypothetical protein